MARDALLLLLVVLGAFLIFQYSPMKDGPSNALSGRAIQPICDPDPCESAAGLLYAVADEDGTTRYVHGRLIKSCKETGCNYCKYASFDGFYIVRSCYYQYIDSRSLVPASELGGGGIISIGRYTGTI